MSDQLTWDNHVKKILVRRVQILQNQASKLALPRQYQYKTDRQRQNVLGWYDIKTEILRATFLQTYKVLNLKKPQELASVMHQNTKSLRIQNHMKLDTRPKWLIMTKLTRSLYRTRAYQYNSI